MTIIRNQDYEQFSQIEDERIRESFRVLYDNTAALQEQVEQLKAKIVEATDLADLQTEVSTLFDGSATTNAGSSFTLPVATSSTLGGVKDGAGVTIASDGTLSVDTHNHDTDYADASHGHTGYASSGHAHTGVYQPAGSYASSGHGHSEYASSGHTHNYASSGHTHNYASSGHTHSYANATHSHTTNDIASNTIIFSHLSVAIQRRINEVVGYGWTNSTYGGRDTLSDRRPGLYLKSHSDNFLAVKIYCYKLSNGKVSLWFQKYTSSGTGVSLSYGSAETKIWEEGHAASNYGL